MAGVEEPLVVLMLGQIENPHAAGVRQFPADRFTELLPADMTSRPHHLVAQEAIEMREGDFPH